MLSATDTAIERVHIILAMGIPGASDRHCSSERQTATKTPTKPPPTAHTRRSDAGEMIPSHRQSDHTQTNSFQS